MRMHLLMRSQLIPNSGINALNIYSMRLSLIPGLPRLSQHHISTNPLQYYMHFLWIPESNSPFFHFLWSNFSFSLSYALPELAFNPSFCALGCVACDPSVGPELCCAPLDWWWFNPGLYGQRVVSPVLCADHFGCNTSYLRLIPSHDRHCLVLHTHKHIMHLRTHKPLQ